MLIKFFWPIVTKLQYLLQTACKSNTNIWHHKINVSIFAIQQLLWIVWAHNGIIETNLQVAGESKTQGPHIIYIIRGIKVDLCIINSGKDRLSDIFLYLCIIHEIWMYHWKQKIIIETQSAIWPQTCVFGEYHVISQYVSSLWAPSFLPSSYWHNGLCRGLRGAIWRTDNQ